MGSLALNKLHDDEKRTANSIYPGIRMKHWVHLDHNSIYRNKLKKRRPLLISYPGRIKPSYEGTCSVAAT